MRKSRITEIGSDRTPVENDRSWGRRIAFVSLGAALAGGMTAALLLVPGIVGQSTVPTGAVAGTVQLVSNSLPLAVSTDQNGVLPGSSFNVTGTGYNSCPDFGHRTVNVLWDGASMNTTVPIQSDGTFAARVTVPSSAAVGNHFVYGQCVDGGEWARTTFTVTVPG